MGLWILGELRSCALLAAAIAVPALTGCDRIGNLSPQQHVQKAKDYEGKGDFQASIIELKSALQAAPDNAEARWMLGEIYVKAGQGSDAEKELLRAQKLGINEESLKVPLGKALLLQQSYQRVLNEIKAGPTTSAKNAAKILQMQGDAQLGLGRLEQGCALFAQSVGTDPANVPTYWGLAECAVAANDFALARGHLERALKIDAKDAGTWILVGELDRLKNDAKTAEADYLNALKSDPKNVAAHLSLASLHLAAGRFEAAQTEVGAARKSAPNNLMVEYTQALVYFRQGKQSQARDALQEVLRNAPDHLPSTLLAGAVAFSLGSYEQAEQYTANVVARSPRNRYARKLLAATLLKLGQPSRALDTLKPALAGDPKDADLLALAGETYLQVKDGAKAAEYFEKAATAAPNSAKVRTALGVARLATGEAVHGVEELETAVQLDPSSTRADMALILVHLRKHEYDKALAAVGVLEKKLPNSPVVYNLRGGAYLGKSDLVNARKSFEQALVVAPTYVTAAINLAKLDLVEKNPQAARARFEAVLAKDKDNLQAMLALANLAVDEKQMVSWLERASKAHPATLQPRRLLAEYFVRKNEPQKALVIAREAQAANVRDPEALSLLGETQLAAGEKQNALTTYTQLAELLPQSPLAYFKLASVQSDLQNLGAAKESVNRSLQLKPDYLDAQAALVTIELRAGRYAEAIKVAQQVQKQRPTSPAGLALEGDILMAQKLYVQAAKAYESAWGLGRSATLAIRIFDAYGRAGKGRDGETRMLQWLKERPGDQAVRFYLAGAYTAAGQNQAAIEQYQVLLQREPNNVLALNNLAWVYHKTKDPKALELAERAYKLQPDAANVLDTMGWINVEQGQIARGLDSLKKATSAAPGDAEIKYHYAAALAKTGDRASARKLLEELLAVGGAFPQREDARALLQRL